ncbi:MAG: hypothetical protein HQL29_04640 [Candidatus Omnitrophica bacterium]|nr:hypothetical protein [Candidatus Omnitrophota bacterium]
MAKKEVVLKKISGSQVKTFKIKNRKGYAAVCLDNLTEGATLQVALDRMDKALKRIGYIVA